MRQAETLQRYSRPPRQTVHVHFDNEPLDADLARLKELARNGGCGVNLAEMSDDGIIARLLGR